MVLVRNEDLMPGSSYCSSIFVFVDIQSSTSFCILPKQVFFFQPLAYTCLSSSRVFKVLHFSLSLSSPSLCKGVVVVSLCVCVCVSVCLYVCVCTCFKKTAIVHFWSEMFCSVLDHISFPWPFCCTQTKHSLFEFGWQGRNLSVDSAFCDSVFVE